MTSAERFLALRRLSVFRSLYDGEVLQLAAAVGERSYAPGARIASAGSRVRQLNLVAEGGLEIEGLTGSPEVFGARALLSGEPLGHAVRAGPDGVHVLLLKRSHFFTLVNESPGLVPGLLDPLGDSFRGERVDR